MIDKTALIIGITTYLFWSFFSKGVFYVGNAIFILLVMIELYKHKKTTITYLLLCVSINNLLDELLFNPTKIQWNEIVFFFVCIVVKKIKDVRKSTQ